MCMYSGNLSVTLVKDPRLLLRDCWYFDWDQEEQEMAAVSSSWAVLVCHDNYVTVVCCVGAWHCPLSACVMSLLCVTAHICHNTSHTHITPMSLCTEKPGPGLAAIVVYYLLTSVITTNKCHHGNISQFSLCFALLCCGASWPDLSSFAFFSEI